MTRWEAFTAICSYLRAEFLGGGRDAPGEMNWELIIEVASFHYVTAALAGCLRSDTKLPAEVRDYFEAALALNKQRNERILESVARLAGLLNAIDIEPMLLKGAAHLVEETYPDPAFRILGDVDILLRADRSREAVAALAAAGFRTNPTGVVPPPTHHHLRMLHDPETGIGVELHTDVIDRSADAVIATAWFSENSRPAKFRDRRVRLPEPTRNAGHTIFHSEIFHGLYERNKISLRHLVDLALIRVRHDAAIDWNELDHRFSAAGFGELLATYLFFADALLGQPAPKLSHAPRADAMAELRNTESRDGFAFQIDQLKSAYDNAVTAYSLAAADRDRIQADYSLTAADRDRIQADYSLAAADRDRIQADLAAVLSSRSWRLTKPLRAIVTASRRWLR